MSLTIVILFRGYCNLTFKYHALQCILLLFTCDNLIMALVSSFDWFHVPIFLNKSLHNSKEISYCHSATYWWSSAEAC